MRQNHRIIRIDGAVVAEFFTAIGGLGFFILYQSRTYHHDEAFVGVLLLAAFGVSFELLVNWGTRRLLPWYRRDERVDRAEAWHLVLWRPHSDRQRRKRPERAKARRSRKAASHSLAPQRLVSWPNASAKPASPRDRIGRQAAQGRHEKELHGEMREGTSVSPVFFLHS